MFVKVPVKGLPEYKGFRAAKIFKMATMGANLKFS